jgi:hypothetical protein
MFPVAVMPYDGMLHPGKRVLTIRTERNTRLVDVYGPVRTLRRSLLRRIAYDLKELLKRKIPFLRRGDGIQAECYFRNTPGVRKEPAYVYFGGAVGWYFGESFLSKLQEAVKEFSAGRDKTAGSPGHRSE